MSNNYISNSISGVSPTIAAPTGLSIKAQIAKLEAVFPPELDHDWWLKSRFRKSAQDAKWSFCLTAGTIGPRIRRDHEQTSPPAHRS